MMSFQILVFFSKVGFQQETDGYPKQKKHTYLLMDVIPIF